MFSPTVAHIDMTLMEMSERGQHQSAGSRLDFFCVDCDWSFQPVGLLGGGWLPGRVIPAGVPGQARQRPKLG